MKISKEIYNQLYENIMNNLNHIVFEELSKYEDTIECDDFYINIYRKERTEDAMYIANNSRMILEFMRNGYAAVSEREKNRSSDSNYKPNLESTFAGLQGHKDIRKKCIEIKIAYDRKTDEVIAIALYNPFMTGKKCIGMTITDKTEFLKEGKEAVKEIIRFDINNHKMFYWCECSGAIEHYFEVFKGFKIPNTYAVQLYENIGRASMIVSLSEDGYHYTRKLNVDGEYYDIEKVIYGFPSQEIFDEMMKTNKYSIDNQLRKIDNDNINEDADYRQPSDIEKADMILDVFYYSISDGFDIFSEYAMNILRKYMRIVKDAIDSDKHYSRYTKNDLIEIYEMGEQYLILCSELKLYPC